MLARAKKKDAPHPPHTHLVVRGGLHVHRQLLVAAQQAQRKVIGDQDIIFSSDRAVVDQPSDVEGRMFEQRLEERAKEREKEKGGVAAAAAADAERPAAVPTGTGALLLPEPAPATPIPTYEAPAEGDAVEPERRGRNRRGRRL